MVSNLFLCLDCGGSKTAAAIASADGQVIATGFGGPSNYTAVGMTAFIHSVQAATLNALKSMPNLPEHLVTLPPPTGLSPFKAVALGVSGVDKPQDVAELSPVLSNLFGIPEGPRLKITNDTHLLASPLQQHPDANAAVVVIGGTGSNVVSFRASEGSELKEMGRVGGYGWVLGDEGSGFHVGKATLQWILESYDQSRIDGSTTKSSPLQQAIFEHYDIQSPPALFGVVYAADPNGLVSSQESLQPAYLGLERKHRIAALTPLVFSAAFQDGDRDALALLRKTAGALADQIRKVLSGVGERKIEPSTTVLCFGGSLVGVQGYRDLIVEDLRVSGGHEFAAVEFVKEAHVSGAEGLARLFQ